MTRKNLLLALSFIGILISAYLTYAKVTSNPLICGLDRGCDIVQQSSYSTLFGIPLGFWGLIYYFALVILFSNDAVKFAKTTASIAVLWGVAFSIYLTLIEIFVIHAFCYWCLGSAAVSVLIACVNFLRKSKITE